MRRRVATFRRITRRDDPGKLAATAAQYQGLLTEALAIARRKAGKKPKLIRDILATGTAEGLNSGRDAKYAVVSYRAPKYKRTWLSLIGWQYLRDSTAEDWADSMIETVEANVRMTHTDSWPQPPAHRSGTGNASRTSQQKRNVRRAKAEGRPAVEAWLERVKPELQPLVRRIDRLILEAMPHVVCAVKWGVPFYGLTGQGWIAGVNSFKAHVKLVLFAGSALKPAPPQGKRKNSIDYHSEEELDEKQLKAWLRQAKKLPGWGRV